MAEISEHRKKGQKKKSGQPDDHCDQFEEFFTNPENFYNEAPSQDSQIVVNLVLETARIAIKKIFRYMWLYHAFRLYRTVFCFPGPAGIYWFFPVFCSAIKKKGFKTGD